MGKKRVIDTDGLYFDPALFGLLGERGYLFYIRLWCLAEDWGGLEEDCDSISLQTGVLRMAVEEVRSLIEKMVEKKKLVRFQAKGKNLLWIVNFFEHQPLNNPALPSLPLPEWIQLQICEYPSGKKYAKYLVVPGKLPPDIREITGSLPVDYQENTGRLSGEEKQKLCRNHKKPKETVSMGPEEQKIFDSWNAFCKRHPEISKLLSLSESRREKLRKRMGEQKFNFQDILDAAEKQPFLLGKNNRGWVFSFDWIVENDRNFLNVLEHKYRSTGKDNAEQAASLRNGFDLKG